MYDEDTSKCRTETYIEVPDGQTHTHAKNALLSKKKNHFSFTFFKEPDRCTHSLLKYRVMNHTHLYF